ncbi:MAG: endo-1,4-beta-xylanase [Anaerolineales bacterium]|nr:endo-1,4-beta-xylanase [Anaerolineales bacterium]
MKKIGESSVGNLNPDKRRSTGLTRREFLKLCETSVIGLLLTACSSKLTPTVLPISTNTSSPTNTPFPTSTATLTNTPEPTNTATATPTPHPPTLRVLADAKGVKIYILALARVFTENQYRDVVLKTGNGIITPTGLTGLNHDGIFKGVDWNEILSNWPEYEKMLDMGIVPNEQQLNWGPSEDRIQFAEQNRMEVMAFHVLPEGGQISDEIIAASKTKSDFAKIMKFTTKVRALHFIGRIKIWSGANEIIATRLYGSGTGREFVKTMVDNDLIHNLFVWLKEADPNTIGLLSESNVVEATSQPAYQRIHDEYFKLLDYLIARDTPVDGGGMHNHFWVYDPPRPEAVRAVIQEFEARGKVAHATETTVNLNPIYPLWEDRPRSVADIEDVLGAQAKVFVDMLKVFTSTGNVFGMFGVTDAYSWYDEVDTYGYTGAGAHIFDRNYQQKPAYDQMWAYLQSLPDKK